MFFELASPKSISRFVNVHIILSLKQTILLRQTKKKTLLSYVVTCYSSPPLGCLSTFSFTVIVNKPNFLTTKVLLAVSFGNVRFASPIHKSITHKSLSFDFVLKRYNIGMDFHFYKLVCLLYTAVRNLC